MYLGPIINSKVLNDHPPFIEYKIEEIVKRHETTLGYRRYYSTGFQFNFTLSWKRSIVTELMWATLKDLLNLKNTLTFIPFPDKYYSSSFIVRWVNSFDDMSPFQYIGIGYQGSVILETVTPIQTIPAWAT